MLTGDHIVLSMGLAVLCSRRLDLKFVQLATILILMNCIDYDHLLYYHLDSLESSSLVLYPLHIYAGVIIFSLCIFGLFFQKYLKLIFAIIAGLSLHLSADALAAVFNYRPMPLIVMAFIGLFFVIYLFKIYVKQECFLKLSGFLLISWFICSLETFLTVIVFNMNMQESALFWVLPPSLCLLIGASFYLLFRQKSLLS